MAQKSMQGNRPQTAGEDRIIEYIHNDHNAVQDQKSWIGWKSSETLCVWGTYSPAVRIVASDMKLGSLRFLDAAVVCGPVLAGF